MGQLSTHDLVLLAISQYPQSRVAFEELEKLAKAIGRSYITLKKNLTLLKKQNLITKSKTYKNFNFKLTQEGNLRLEEIFEELDNYYFTPEHHFIPNPVRFMDVMNTINNSDHRIFLTKLYFSKDSFDLLETLDTLKLLDSETSIYNLITAKSMFNESSGISNFVHIFMDSTMYGTLETAIDEPNQTSHEVLLINADMRISRGDLEEGLELYENVLDMNVLPQDIWFIAIVGKIKTLAKLDRKEDMERTLTETRKAIENKMALGYLNQIEADILGIEGDLDKAKVLFESCIGTFRHYNHPIFLAIAFINYGILMFKKERYEDAERLWKQAKKCAIEGGSDYLYSIALTNLASIIRMNGDIEKARKHLEMVKKIHEATKNLEKLSDVQYNISLLYLSQGDVKNAIEIFNKSILSTYPFLSEDLKKERVSFFTSECKNLKYPPIWDGSKFKLV